MRALLLGLVISCGGSPPPKAKVTCDQPEPGQAMTEAQCTCREARVVLAVGRAVELHCDEPGEVDIGPVRIGDRDGWCCK